MSENPPIRIQRRRSKGFNLQAQSPDGRPVVSVCRPGKWGNPFTVAAYGSLAVSVHERWLAGDARPPGSPRPPEPATIIQELAGKHLACYCPVGGHCHADTLLRLANRGLEELAAAYKRAHTAWSLNRTDDAANTALTRASDALLAHPDNNGAYHS